MFQIETLSFTACLDGVLARLLVQNNIAAAYPGIAILKLKFAPGPVWNIECLKLLLPEAPLQTRWQRTEQRVVLAEAALSKVVLRHQHISTKLQLCQQDGQLHACSSRLLEC